MDLHPLAARFADVADAYERGRPDYGPAVVGAIAAELRIPPGAPVLDLAAGTGKLTAALLEAGLDVVAVEPQASLREVLAAKAGADRVREGVAEAIPLPDDSVAAVAVADAFHWFDHGVVMGEIGRVLRPGGGLAVLATAPDWSEVAWAHEVGTILTSLRPDHPHFDGPSWQETVQQADGWTAPREVRVTTTQPTSPERVLDYLASVSWMAALPEAERSDTLARLRAVIEAGDTPPALPVHVTIGLAELA